MSQSESERERERVRVRVSICACHEICAARFTKCCACHEICASRFMRFTKGCACHEICTPPLHLSRQIDFGPPKHEVSLAPAKHPPPAPSFREPAQSKCTSTISRGIFECIVNRSELAGRPPDTPAWHSDLTQPLNYYHGIP